MSLEWCVENKFLGYEELVEKDHPWNGVKIEELNLQKCKAYTDLTIAEAKELFAKGIRGIPIKIGKKVEAAIFPKKFLELVLLKKLTDQDSALKTKTKDFALVPDSLDVAQLSR